MNRMLASVTSIEEARIVLDAGADVIDLKDPSRGALGALPLDVIRAIVREVAGRRPVSATIGDLPMRPSAIVHDAEAVAATGVDIVKIGFFGSTGHSECVHALGALASGGQKIVAVLFADQSPDFSLLYDLADAGFYGAMLDTAYKDGRRLPDHLSLPELARFVGLAKPLGLLTGLAGSLREDDIPSLVPLAADYLGFRGALCDRSDRTGALNGARTNRLIRVLQQYNNIGNEVLCFQG